MPRTPPPRTIPPWMTTAPTRSPASPIPAPPVGPQPRYLPTRAAPPFRELRLPPPSLLRIRIPALHPCSPIDVAARPPPRSLARA